MTIGLTFPVIGVKGIRSMVPWSLVEAHRARIEANYNCTLERLYALGGLQLNELASCLLDKDWRATTAMTEEESKKMVDDRIEMIKSGHFSYLDAIKKAATPATSTAAETTKGKDK